MAKRTVLDMVQGILNVMDSDEVSSISDTLEASQVANILRDIYFEIVDDKELPHNNALFTLTSSGSATTPTTMKLPDNINKIYWIKYDIRNEAGDDRDYAIVHYMQPEDFINYVNSRRSTDTTSNTTVTLASGISIVIDKLSHPQFYTSFDDEYFIFDAYNSVLDAWLQSAKTMCYGSTRPTFSVTDSFIPDLPENLFNLLYNTAMNRCMAVVKHQANPMIDRLEKRTRVRSQRNKWREDMKYDWVDFGRKKN